jgi:hypothetical protein
MVAQKCAYGHGPFGANFHKVTILFFRTTHSIIVMNNTGSDILMIFNTDLL